MVTTVQLNMIPVVFNHFLGRVNTFQVGNMVVMMSEVNNVSTVNMYSSPEPIYNMSIAELKKQGRINIGTVFEEDENETPNSLVMIEPIQDGLTQDESNPHLTHNFFLK